MSDNWDTDTYSAELAGVGPIAFGKVDSTGLQEDPGDGYFVTVGDDGQLYFRGLDRAWKPLEGLNIEPGDEVAMRFEVGTERLLRVRVTRANPEGGEPLVIADRVIEEKINLPDGSAGEIRFVPMPK